jgi:hypothetical protein
VQAKSGAQIAATHAIPSVLLAIKKVSARRSRSRV